MLHKFETDRRNISTRPPTNPSNTRSEWKIIAIRRSYSY